MDSLYNISISSTSAGFDSVTFTVNCLKLLDIPTLRPSVDLYSKSLGKKATEENGENVEYSPSLYFQRYANLTNLFSNKGSSPSKDAS